MVIWFTFLTLQRHAKHSHFIALLQSSASKSWQNEAGLVDSSVVVSAQFLFFLRRPLANWLGDITVGILAADHEANLARWVGRNGGVGIFDCWEDLLAILLELGDQGKVKPLVLG